MGCGTSKLEQKPCRNCQRSFSMPPPRSSFSIPLTSSTMESMKFDYSTRRSIDGPVFYGDSSRNMEVLDTKIWSRRIGEKVEEVVHNIPQEEPECINAKELMEGLEEDSSSLFQQKTLISDSHPNINSMGDRNSSISDDVNLKSLNSDSHLKIHSANGSGNGTNPKFLISDFHSNSNPKSLTDGYSTSLLDDPNSKSPISIFDPDNKNYISDDLNPKTPISGFQHNPRSIISDFVSSDSSNSKPLISDFDPNIIAKFRKALQSLSPVKPSAVDFRRYKPIDFPKIINKKSQVIIYFTSIRGVRKTYEDCCSIRSAIKGLGFKVDERDVSMHSAFKEELKELLKREDGLEFRLPMVFIGEDCVGGAKEVLQMHEEGRLKAALEGCETENDSKECRGCCDVRFVTCESCCGSCKVYEEEEDGDGGFRRCSDCNENGIKRCPICCSN